MMVSKEEAKLCKEIAKYYEKPITEYEQVIASWPDDCMGDIVGVLHSIKEGIVLAKNMYLYPEEIIPLWTFEDAIEWLEEKGFIYITLSMQTRSSFISASTKLELGKRDVKTAFGTTPLEAILKVVLAVVKEENGKN